MKLLIYNWYRRACNWTPRQVDELYLEELEWFPILEEAVLQASDDIMKMNQAQGKKQH